jgi:hypothetical protein
VGFCKRRRTRASFWRLERFTFSVAATGPRSVAECIRCPAFLFKPELAVNVQWSVALSSISLYCQCENVARYPRLGKSESYDLYYIRGAKRFVGLEDSSGPSPQETEGGQLFAKDEDAFQSHCLDLLGIPKSQQRLARRQRQVSFCHALRPSERRRGCSSSGLSRQEKRLRRTL